MQAETWFCTESAYQRKLLSRSIMRKEWSLNMLSSPDSKAFDSKLISKRSKPMGSQIKIIHLSLSIYLREAHTWSEMLKLALLNISARLCIDCVFGEKTSTLKVWDSDWENYWSHVVYAVLQCKRSVCCSKQEKQEHAETTIRQCATRIVGILYMKCIRRVVWFPFLTFAIIFSCPRRWQACHKIRFNSLGSKSSILKYRHFVSNCLTRVSRLILNTNTFWLCNLRLLLQKKIIDIYFLCHQFEHQQAFGMCKLWMDLLQKLLKTYVKRIPQSDDTQKIRNIFRPPVKHLSAKIRDTR